MKNKEIEYKYWANDLSKEDFLDKLKACKDVISGRVSLPDSFYVVSCDDYYTKEDGDGSEFIRFRKGGTLYELTIKKKEKENVVRTEVNLNVTDNEDSVVSEFIGLLGYNKAFQVYKEAWIWHLKECDISYYTLSDGRSVVELEALNYLTVEEGVRTISYWEKALGLKSLKKESRSLYEIFSEEIKESL